jgi:hypothetical protein
MHVLTRGRAGRTETPKAAVNIKVLLPLNLRQGGIWGWGREIVVLRMNKGHLDLRGMETE